MDWVLLVIAGVLEICWAVGLKYTEGFTKPAQSIATVLAIIVSMYLLSKAAQTIPIGTAYAAWVGIGATGAAILGIVLFNESTSWPRLVFLALLIVSILGLKFTSAP